MTLEDDIKEQAFNRMLTEISQNQQNTNDLLKKIYLRHFDKSENNLIQDVVISASDDYNVPTIANDRFTKARIFSSVKFNASSIAGVTFEIYYNGALLGGQPAEVLKMSPTNVAMSAGSDSFDISGLSGYTIKIVNHDISQSVTINNLRLVMFND